GEAWNADSGEGNDSGERDERGRGPGRRDGEHHIRRQCDGERFRKPDGGGDGGRDRERGADVPGRKRRIGSERADDGGRVVGDGHDGERDVPAGRDDDGGEY